VNIYRKNISAILKFVSRDLNMGVLRAHNSTNHLSDSLWKFAFI